MSEAIVLVSYRSRPGEAETARREILALVETVLEREPECDGITMLQEGDDPSRITLVERWPSRDFFLEPHMQQPHIQEFVRNAAAFLSGPPEITFWSEVRID